MACPENRVHTPKSGVSHHFTLGHDWSGPIFTRSSMAEVDWWEWPFPLWPPLLPLDLSDWPMSPGGTPLEPEFDGIIINEKDHLI